ncbi:RDD family protein [Sanyastnella coralliicola]|uniref:RDD family protein n=1 Tax=Sanyastnella coralliicola TaxID=3069118 RepID=UPI0027B8FE93|nr:RDD family protein [Longitalea sp. SCSIO 12813]
MEDNKPSLISRIGAMLLDYMILNFALPVLGMILMIPFMLDKIPNGPPSHDPEPFEYTYMTCVFGIIFGILFAKDVFKGRSIAKLAFKQQLVVHRTENTAGPLRSVIRNFTFFIWPIEFIATLISPGRRIGDLIAGTRVIKYDGRADSVKWTQIIVAYVVGVLFCVVTLFGLMFLVEDIIAPKAPKYLESSYNEALSHEIEDLITADQKLEVVPDVRYYDQLKNDSTVSYVSILLDYESGISRQYEVEERIQFIITNKVNDRPLIGRFIHFHYRTGNSETRRHSFDWTEEEKIMNSK